jgi:4a-hydroxytetrahydrobiopterin dehydratase
VNPLASLHCKPLDGRAALSAQDVAAQLRLVDGWALDEGAIQKTFRFADYHQTMAFVNAVAWIAQREDHHPDIAFGYDRCTVRFATHSAGGVTRNDFICAARLDSLFA